jgi:hypothetical protein
MTDRKTDAKTKRDKRERETKKGKRPRIKEDTKGTGKE